MNQKRSFRFLILVFLVAFWVWAAQRVFARVYDQWAEKHMFHVVVRDQAFEDLAHGYQVYLCAPLSDGSLSILYEGHSVHLLHSSNVIALGPGEKSPDIVILMEPSLPEKEKLAKAFPRAQWSVFHNSDIGRAWTTTDFRCQIPFSDLSDPRQKIFTVRRVAAPYWRRTYSDLDSGMGFGFLTWDDKTSNLSDPISPEVHLDYEGLRIQGVIHVNNGGNYEINCKTGNRSEVKIDGQKLFDLSFFRTGYYTAPAADVKKTIRLEAGDHQVEVITCCRGYMVPPDITLRPEGTPGTGQSLWSSFSF